MDWGAVLGGFIGAGIPAFLALLGLQRGRQAADAGAFGPAVLLLDRVDPDRVAINLNPDTTAENAKWAELQKQLDLARERLLIVSAGNPRRRVRELAQAAEAKVYTAFAASHWVVVDMQDNRDNPGGMDHARKAHAEANAVMRSLIDANFGWRVLQRCHQRGSAAAVDPGVRKAVDQSDAGPRAAG